jgi:hypothetical protein
MNSVINFIQCDSIVYISGMTKKNEKKTCRIFIEHMCAFCQFSDER